MNSFFIKSSAALCAALSFTNLYADLNEEVYQLDHFVVSAGPIARPLADYASPFSSIGEAAIQRSGANTLGQLLEGQPGVSATSFGAGASRPIIRGLDGPRVSILESGLSSLDVAETSPDHAVSIEPLLVDRVEILRGPAALLYGGAAIGGVVNVITKELPRERVESDTITSALETRYDSVSEAETYLGYGTTGGENWALSLTGLKRKADNYTIPDGSIIEEDHGDEEEDPSDILAQSFVENSSFSVGATHFFGARNYIGASFSNYDALYGVPGHGHHEEEEMEEAEEEHEEESVSIDLLRKRFDLEIALFEPTDWIKAARIRFGLTDYDHSELEGDETGTVFERDGWELRAEAEHHAWSFIDQGIIGAQLSNTDSLAIGEESGAFGPPTETKNQALFMSEHMHNGSWHLELGSRLEAQQIDAESAENYEDVAYSLAASLIYNLSENDSIAISLQRSQRHPNAGELYADGAHLATSQYEQGDATLGIETAYSTDLSYRYQSSLWTATLSAFYTQYDGHIYSTATGATDTESELPIYQYRAADIVFYGFEVELERQLVQSDNLQVSAGLLMDSVRAENQDTNENLPRIPPLRLGGELRFESGPWKGGVLLRRVFKQDTLAPLETETAAYTDLKLDLAYNHELEGGNVLSLFARVDNLLDEVIRHHSSYIKDEAPQPGRNWMVGARLEF